MTCLWTGSSSSMRSICWFGGSLSSSTCESCLPSVPAWLPLTLNPQNSGLRIFTFFPHQLRAGQAARAELTVTFLPPSSFKQQNLEQRQADVEYELRCLLNKPGDGGHAPAPVSGPGAW